MLTSEQAKPNPVDLAKYCYKLAEAFKSVEVDAQKERLLEKLDARFGRSLKGKTVAVWGLAFKPRTDDMREAPAIVLIERLLAAGAKVQAFDPAAMPAAKRLFGSGVTFAPRRVMRPIT